MKFSWLAQEGLLKTRARWIATISAVLTLSSGCVATGGNDGWPGDDDNGHDKAGVCRTDFEKILIPFDIKGHQHLYFDYRDLAFLLDSNIVVDSIELELTVDGKFKGQDGEIDISLNGYQGCGNSHDPFYRLFDYD